MKKISYPLLILLFISCNKLKDYIPLPSVSQFNKVYGGSGQDGATDVMPTSDGGYIMAGYTESNDGDVSSNHGRQDAWIVKLDKDGNIQWQKTLGGSDADNAYSIAITSEGDYVLTGSTSSNDGDISGNHGQQDAWVVKLDQQGNTLWQKTIGGTNDYRAFHITTTLNGYIIAGYSKSNDGDISGNHGTLDAWVATIKDR
jgi:hypothetical protein